MLTSLTTHEQQRAPRWFFTLNLLVQSDWEMIKCVIVGYVNFLRIDKTLWVVTSHPHIFLPTTQNDLKKIIHRYHDNIYPWKKIRVFGAHLSIPISTSHFNVCTKYSLTKYLSSILSTVAFSQKLYDFVDFFHQKAT